MKSSSVGHSWARYSEGWSDLRRPSWYRIIFYSENRSYSSEHSSSSDEQPLASKQRNDCRADADWSSEAPNYKPLRSATLPHDSQGQFWKVLELDQITKSNTMTLPHYPEPENSANNAF